MTCSTCRDQHASHTLQSPEGSAGTTCSHLSAQIPRGDARTHPARTHSRRGATSLRLPVRPVGGSCVLLHRVSLLSRSPLWFSVRRRSGESHFTGGFSDLHACLSSLAIRCVPLRSGWRFKVAPLWFQPPVCLFNYVSWRALRAEWPVCAQRGGSLVSPHMTLINSSASSCCAAGFCCERRDPGLGLIRLFTRCWASSDENGCDELKWSWNDKLIQRKMIYTNTSCYVPASYFISVILIVVNRTSSEL